VSKLGKIGFLISALALVVLMVTRLMLGGWLNFMWAPLVIAIVALVAAFALDWKFYLEFFSMRTTKHGLNMGTLIILGFLTVVGVNYAGKRFDQSLDLTAEKLHSLSDQSVKALDSLKGDVKIRAFYKGTDQQPERQRVKEALQVYLDASPKLSLEFVDSLVEVKLAKEYLKNFDQLAVIAELAGKKVTIEEPFDEEKVTAALLKLSKTEQQVVYFLSGHGEKDIDATAQDGLSQLKEGLVASSINAAKLNLLKGDPMPPVAGSVIAIVGPKTQILENELNELRKFARAGGSLLVAADPGEGHQIANLTKPLGVEFKNNYVLNDRVRLLGVGLAAILGMVFDRDSDITKSFADSENYALFLLGSEVTKAPDADAAITYRDIVQSEASSFSVNKIDREVKPGDRRQFVLAVSAQGHFDPEKKDPEFRGVFFGDSDFLGNQVLFQGVNRDLALNALAFLAKDDAMISIRPKKPEGTQLTMTRNQQIGAIAAGVALPVALFLVALVVWFRRKGL
jgi:hypothetical protein